MQAKILVTREVYQETLEFLGHQFDVTANQGDELWDADKLAQMAAGKEGLLTSSSDKIDAALLARCPQLKAVCNIAVGYNNIDLAACSERGIMATNTPGVLTESTADFTWALMLAAARRVAESERWLRAGHWKRVRLKDFPGVDVNHATLGIIGMGRIGQAVARRARGFDMKVVYHDQARISEALEQQCNASYVSKEDLLRDSDFVTLHLPYSRENHHAIGAGELARMKRTAVLLNVARGGIVDDAALVAALKSGTIAAAGLDVFENEPQLNPALLELANVVLSPHIGSASDSTRRRMAMLAAENLVAALSTGKPPNLLNPKTV
jgi:glyoxylate/hydroxypyruvate/2-ketogluconate reductase